MLLLRLFLCLALLLPAAATAAPAKKRARPPSSVVRPAPDFAIDAGPKTRALKNLRGQAVVLVIADSPKEGALKKQMKWLREVYQTFASKGVVFVAALREGEGPLKSDIPFVLAANGPAVASAYGVGEDFALVIIGPDGNIDYQTDEVRTGERVRDVIQNSYTVQAERRR